MKCQACNQEMGTTEKEMYQYVESGLDNIYLDGVSIYRCEDCGEEAPILPSIKDLHRTIAISILIRNEPLNGPEIRYIRKHMRYKSKDFGELLGVTPQTISGWEKGANPSESNDRLIRAVCLIKMLETDQRFLELVAYNMKEYLDFLAHIEKERKAERNAVSVKEGHVLGEPYQFNYMPTPTTG